jgi:hypothetical protein
MIAGNREKSLSCLVNVTYTSNMRIFKEIFTV